MNKTYSKIVDYILLQYYRDMVAIASTPKEKINGE